MEDYAPPNPYEEGLKLRAAGETTEQAFARQWRAARTLELEAERRWMETTAPVRRLTAAEEADLERFAPPNPYLDGIKALQARDARARETKEAR